ncbi:MAG: response regulator transcription factor [Chitinophagaceae bacterium]|nr:MAG: response regulator transcription factor [Chitinophagaceae bacterium]
MTKEIKCVIIDDEPPALQLLAEYVSGFPELKLLQTFNDAIEGREFIQANKVDLLFVDINMPDISGLELVKSLDPQIMVIFTTAHKKFAIEGFELNAIDYLLKPISRDRFSKAVRKAAEYFEYKSATKDDRSGSLFVYSEYRMVKIDLSQVIYIESLEDYIRIVFEKDRPVLTLMTLKKVLEKLPSSRFRRIHRSYIVSIEKVKMIHNRKVLLSNNVELPVSDSYLDFIPFWKQGQ